MLCSTASHYQGRTENKPGGEGATLLFLYCCAELSFNGVVLFSIHCRVREAALKKAKYLQTVGKTAEANKAPAEAVEIDYQLNLAFINMSYCN